MSPTKHVLIIGAGYLGTALANRLNHDGFHPILADNQIREGVFHADIADIDSLNLLANDIPTPDIIILAVSTKGGDVSDYKNTYLNGVNNVFSCFPDSTVIFCSSTSVYGITDGRWATETHNVYPQTTKGKILLEAEQLVLDHHGVVARLAAIYGPNRCELVNKFITKHQSLSTETDKWVNYIHRDDAASAITLLCQLRQSGKIVNISDSTPLTLDEIYQYLHNLLETQNDLASPPERSKNRGLTNQRISCNLLLSLGWEPLYPSFLDGVHNVLESLDIHPEE